MTSIFATYVSNGINLALVEKKSEFALLSKKRHSLLFEIAPEQRFFVYSFGALVFFGTDQKTANKIIKKFLRALEKPTSKEFIEEYGYEISGDLEKENAEFEIVKLKLMDENKMRLIADTLAQSVAIDYFDFLTDDTVSNFDWLNRDLERKGRLRIRTKPLVRIIGTANTILQSSIVRMALLDKPEVIWEEAELEALYSSLRKMFELDDRFKIIEFKVQYIRETSEMAINFLRDRRANMLETTIVLLLVVEVALWVYEILVGFNK